MVNPAITTAHVDGYETPVGHLSPGGSYRLGLIVLCGREQDSPGSIIGECDEV